jgi:hypothetical protein
MPRSIPGRDILQPFQSEAQSAANVVATAISPAISNVQSAAQSATDIIATSVPTAISKVESAANAAATTAISKVKSAANAATAIPDINNLKEFIPRNCSLGTTQFCFGFDNRTECHDLALNLSNTVPEVVASFVDNQVEALEPLRKALTKVNIQNCLISGLVLMFIMTAIFICSIFSQVLGFVNFLLKLGIYVGMVIIFIAGLICCVTFIIPTIILFDAQSKIKDLPSAIQVQKGGVSNHCVGALCCSVIMMLMATLSPILWRR